MHLSRVQVPVELDGSMVVLVYRWQDSEFPRGSSLFEHLSEGQLLVLIWQDVELPKPFHMMMQLG